MRQMTPVLAAACAAFFALQGSAQAGPLGYDEASDGDVGGTLQLGIGENTVAGELSGYDPDSFVFVVPEGGSLRVISLDIQPAPGQPGQTVGFSLGRGDYEERIASTSIAVPSSGALFSASLPLSAGSYYLSQGLSGLATAQYEFTLEVEATTPVPVPPTLALLLGGGLCAAAVGRARRTARTPAAG